MSLAGTRLELEIGAVAHGGHCVARHEGRVVFVRHTLPGERVLAVVTEGEQDDRFLRADAVEVLEAAPGRVEPRCAVSGPGGCGGCDFQHVDLATQRALLGDVVAEQLRRLARLDVEVQVEAVDDGDGLGWRTRVGWVADDDGHLALRKHRSHDLVATDPCPIAHPDLAALTSSTWPADRVTGVVSSRGDRVAVVEGLRGPTPDAGLDGVVEADGPRPRVVGRGRVTERVHGRRFDLVAQGFWQAHPRAAELLVGAVLEAAAVRPGESVADLYAGAGLFSAFLADAAGEGGSVLAVEGDRAGARDAERNLAGAPTASVVQADVAQALRRGLVPPSLDVVVLDPPRTGARAKVVREIAARRPTRVVYVACDPAALARDVATFAEEGYVLTGLRAFALFPMTHHVECVALLTPA